MCGEGCFPLVSLLDAYIIVALLQIHFCKYLLTPYVIYVMTWIRTPSFHQLSKDYSTTWWITTALIYKYNSGQVTWLCNSIEHSSRLCACKNLVHSPSPKCIYTRENILGNSIEFFLTPILRVSHKSSQPPPYNLPIL